MSTDPNAFDANPFADPSIQRASQNVQLVDSSLNDYNPFAQKNVQTKPAAIIPTASTTSISGVSPQVASSQPKAQPESFDPPPYAQSSAQKVNLSDIEKQQQELNRRAAELDRRERLLSSGQTADARGTGIKIKAQQSANNEDNHDYDKFVEKDEDETRDEETDKEDDSDHETNSDDDESE